MAHSPQNSLSVTALTALQGEPSAEIDIDEAMVRRLLSVQHSDLSHLPLRPLDYGWDNAIFQLGDRFLVRLPRRQAAAKLIEHEQAWLPQLAPRLPIPVPVPIRVGTPTPEYPWYWSVVPWIEGQTADQMPPKPHQAERFAAFLRSLHQPAPDHQPVPVQVPPNPYRGVPLRQRAETTAARLARLTEKTDVLTAAILDTWHGAVAAPIDCSGRWLHGDLHARNVLVKDGAIAGVIDWGDITVGDIATDLASVWMLFPDADARQQAIAAYGPVSDATLLRAKGWAIFFGVTLLDTGLTNSPRHAAMGRQTLERLAADL